VGAPDTVRCTGCSTMNPLLSGIVEGTVAKIHRTVRWANSARANVRQRDQRATRGQSQRSLGRTGLSGVHQTVSGMPRRPRAQWSASPKKERNRALFMSGGAPTVRCANRQKARIAYQMEIQRAPSCLGAIKGTSRRMEHHTKPPLKILRSLDSANTHPDHCD
jgi:hypothetical protein